jgi:hypothetical protein
VKIDPALGASANIFRVEDNRSYQELHSALLHSFQSPNPEASRIGKVIDVTVAIRSSSGRRCRNKATRRAMKCILGIVALASVTFSSFVLSARTKYEVSLVQHGHVVILQVDSTPPILSPPPGNSTKYFRK